MSIPLIFPCFDFENPTVSALMDSWTGEVFEDEFGNWFPWEEMENAARDRGVDMAKLQANFEELDIYGDLESSIFGGKFVVRFA